MGVIVPIEIWDATRNRFDMFSGTDNMKIHCVYCGSKLTVTTIRFDLAPKAEQLKRLVFEEEHTQTCGPKPIGMMLEVGVHE